MFILLPLIEIVVDNYILLPAVFVEALYEQTKLLNLLKYFKKYCSQDNVNVSTLMFRPQSFRYQSPPHTRYLKARVSS